MVIFWNQIARYQYCQGQTTLDCDPIPSRGLAAAMQCSFHPHLTTSV